MGFETVRHLTFSV